MAQAEAQRIADWTPGASHGDSAYRSPPRVGGRSLLYWRDDEPQWRRHHALILNLFRFARQVETPHIKDMSNAVTDPGDGRTGASTLTAENEPKERRDY